MENGKCLVEINEILSHLKQEDLEKIPYEIREAINNKRDMEYEWKYDETKELSQQNVDRKTIAILSFLNMKYLLSNEQKEVMEELHRLNEKKKEEQNLGKYIINNIFNNNVENTYKEKAEIVEIKREKWYKRIYYFVKKFLKI